MMLRVSSKQEGVEVDLESVVDSDADSGLPNGKLMNAFAEVVLGDDDARLADVRDKLRTEMGEAALVDCAGVVANFMMADRIADGAGIVQTRVDLETVQEMISTLGFDKFGSARNTPGVSM